jgi:hypothetical protein
MEVVLVTIAVGFIVLLWGAGVVHRNKSKALTAASSGAVRVESVKSTNVNFTVKQYAEAGWKVTGQTTAKSFLSDAQVTLTFQKD